MNKKNLMLNNKVKNLIYGSVIAAIYAACSLMPGISAISYGPIQFRISEALMLLCLLSPSAVWGVTIGCFLANIFTPFGANFFDLVFGTGATLLAALCTYFFRKFFTKNIYLAPLPTVLFNAFIVGSYLPLFMTDKSGAIWYCIFTVAVGEMAVCYFLGIPLIKTCKRKGFFER